jgi:hypothetical protein
LLLAVVVAICHLPRRYKKSLCHAKICDILMIQRFEKLACWKKFRGLWRGSPCSLIGWVFCVLFNASSAGVMDRAANGNVGRPILEALEPRLLLSGSISGQTFEDVNANGVFDPGEPGLNVPTFDFVYVATPSRDGTLTVTASTDLGLSSEYLTLQAEGIAPGDLFVSGGVGVISAPDAESATPTPEPATMMLLLACVVPLMLKRKRKVR